MSHFDRHGIIDPRTDVLARVSPMGALDVNEHTRLVGPMYGASQDTNFWQNSYGGTNSAVNWGSNKVELVPWTDNNAFAIVNSNRSARFMFAAPNMYCAVMRFPFSNSPTGTSYPGHHLLWGAVNTDGLDIGAGGFIYPNNILIAGGFYFHLADNVLSINARCDGATLLSLSSGSFNGDVKIWNVDNSVHAYEIVYYVASAYFYIDGILIGVLSPSPAYQFGIAKMDFRAACMAYNSIPVGAVGTSAPMISYAQSILRLGKEHTVPTWRYITNGVPTATLKKGPGELHRVINNDNVGSIIFYDATSAVATATICSIDLTKVTGALEFDANFETGLYYALTGAGKVTVTFE